VLVVMLGVGLSGCGGDEGASVASFCAEVKKDTELFKQIGGTQDAINRANTALKELVNNSPSEVKDDVQTLSDGFEKAAAGDFAGVRRNAADFLAATKRVVAYTKKECGFDLDAT
jgi:hypothetical protein